MKILIIPQLTRVGDLMCATPVFHAIKEKYPDSYVAVLIAGRLVGLLKNNPSIDEIIVYRHANKFGTIKKIREGKFDWSFSLSGTSRSSLIAVLAGIPNRAKITRMPRPLSEFLTDWMIPNKIIYEHHTYLPRRYLDLLQFIGIQNPTEKREIGLNLAAEKKAEKFNGFVGISITAGNKIKEWGDDKFLELARRIKNKFGYEIVFIGGKADEDRIKKLIRDEFLVACDFNLEELPSLIKVLRLYIAVDTGPIYIAHALGTPLIDIIGPVDPNEQPPSDSRSIQVRPPANIKPSSFVMKKPGKTQDHKLAIQSISVEDVFGAVERLLS